MPDRRMPGMPECCWPGKFVKNRLSWFCRKCDAKLNFGTYFNEEKTVYVLKQFHAHASTCIETEAGEQLLIEGVKVFFLGYGIQVFKSIV